MKDRIDCLPNRSFRQHSRVTDEVKDDLLPPKPFNEETDNFLQKIALQRHEVIRLRHAVDRISQFHRLLLASLDSSGPDIDAVNEMIKTLDEKFKEVDGTSASVCRAINELKEVVGGNSDTDRRIRKNQLMGLTESLRTVLSKFNQDYVKYEEATRGRAVEYSKKKKALETEEGRVLDFFGDEDQPSTSRPQLLRTVSAFEAVFYEAKERHETIERVEQSIAQLGHLFEELRLYVDHGNDLADHIEKNIERAGEYVEKGQVETGITVQRKEDFENGKGWMGRTHKTLRLLIFFLVSFLILLILTLISLFLRVGLR